MQLLIIIYFFNNNIKWKMLKTFKNSFLIDTERFVLSTAKK